MTTPLDDIRTLIKDLPGADETARTALSASLGRLAEIAAWLPLWSGKAKPEIRRPILAVYAGAPGPARLQASEDGRAMLEAIASGEALISRLAAAGGAGIEAFDLAIDRPIGDIATAAALGERECAATMAFGMEVLAKQPDLLMLADITPDDHRSAAAVACAAFGGRGGDWHVQGEAIDLAVARARREGLADGLEILRQLGGREIAAAAGAILGARAQRTPVILDGYGPCAAAAALRLTDPRAVDHCLVAQRPASPGGARLVEALGLRPVTELDLLVSDGTAALAALSLVKLSAAMI